MIFGHSRPSGVAWNVTGGALVSGIANIADGRPDSTTRFTFNTGTQTLGTICHITADWSTANAIVPRLIELINLSLPVGTKIAVSFRRVADTAGTYPYVPTMFNNNQRIVAGVRGEQTAIIMLAASGVTAVCGVDIQIFNDVNGSPTILPGANFTLGEAVICVGTELDIDADWNLETIDPTTMSFSWSKQPYSTPGVVYQQLTWKFPIGTTDAFFGNPNAPTVVDYEQLGAKLDRGKVAMYVPRYLDASGAFSSYLLHRYAMMGTLAKLPQAAHKQGDYFGSNPVIVIESPIPT